MKNASRDKQNHLNDQFQYTVSMNTRAAFHLRFKKTNTKAESSVAFDYVHDDVDETLDWLCRLALRSEASSSLLDCTLRRRDEAVAVSNCWRVCSCMILFLRSVRGFILMNGCDEEDVMVVVIYLW